MPVMTLPQNKPSSTQTPTPPRVSVVMPVYNTERFVGATVQAMLDQTFRDFEFIIINDGSTDGSLAVLESYAKQDARIRLISRPNTGYIKALNEGLALARGEYLARMDADDLARADRLEKQVKTLDEDPALVAVGSAAMLIDEHGDPIGEAPVPITHEQIEERHLRGGSGIHHPAVTIRTQALRDVGGYDESLQPCEDYDLWLRLGEVGKLLNLPEPLLTKRQLVSGAVVKGIDRHTMLVTKIVQNAYQRRGIDRTYTHKPLPLQRPVDFWRQWAWMALRGKNRKVACRYTFKSLVNKPAELDSWKLLWCWLRGDGGLSNEQVHQRGSGS
jgi:glycosyltransferase involved in cell wall biosynthesis